MAKPRTQYGICVCNEGHVASLDLWKVYRLIPDPVATKDSMVRVVDEEDEDYLYPSAWFVEIELPAAVHRKIKQVGARRQSRKATKQQPLTRS